MNPIKILLADDHRIVREGLRALLVTQTDFKIVGETGSGLDVQRKVEELSPDVVIMDLMMPGLGGLEATRQLCQKPSHPKVVALSVNTDAAYVLAALRNGASGYVLKDSTSADLVQAVRDVIAGRRYLSPPFSDAALRAYEEKTRKTGTLDLYETLTSREREVLQLCAEGHTNAEIGGKLFISHRTVETHRANLMHKLRLKGSTDLIRFALQRGILPLERQSTPDPARPSAH